MLELRRIAVPLAALVAAALAGCGVSGGSAIEAPVQVYVSLPLSGPRASSGQDAADGARLALEQAGGKAGSVRVEAVYLDDAKGKPWDPVTVGQNARSAVQDSSAAAYIGELDNEPTRASVPITNDAGMVQVSPGAGAVDLTQPATGYPNTPDRYQPSGSASFGRVVPADDVVAHAAADWASELALRRVTVVSDGSAFQNLMAQDFTDAAEESGIAISKGKVGPAYDAGTQTLALEDGGLELRSSAELDPSHLANKAFAGDFRQAFQREPGPFAAYGYEAMGLVLQAIADAGDDASQFRDNVRENVFGAERRGTVIGDYEITDEGNTTLCAIQRYRGAQPLGADCPPAF